jgi:WD40 repeat protein
VLKEQNVGTFGHTGHEDYISSLSLSEDGTTVLSAGKDGMISAWQIGAGAK